MTDSLEIAKLDLRPGPARIIYMGTPAMAVPQLEALVEAGHDIALVITNPDRRRGRGSKLMPSPVKAAAQKLGLEISHDVEDALNVEADLGVIVAYGQLIGPELLAELPMVNLHFSLLPRWRGAAPVERAILAGDDTTGVCVMQVVKALDAGGVYSKKEVPIGEKTSSELAVELVEASAELLLEALANGFGEPVEQSGEVTYAKKLSSKDFVLNFEQSAQEISRVVRLGRAVTEIKGRRLRIHEARYDNSEVQLQPGSHVGNKVATGCGWLELVTVQPEGRPKVDAQAWLNGARLEPGDLFGTPKT